jgi:hypothetical protein
LSLQTLRPDGAGAETNIAGQWPNSGEHWDKVDEATPDGSSTYVRHNLTSYATDTYALPSGAGVGDISQVTVYARCYGISGNYNYAKTVIRTHGGLYESTGHNLTTSWENLTTEYTTNPYTGNPWTWAEIDALEAGVALKSSSAGNFFAICTQVYVEVSYSTEQFKSSSDAGYGEDSALTLWKGEDRDIFASDAGSGVDAVAKLDKPPPARYTAFFVEKFTGTKAYSRPFWTQSIPDARLQREPVPFDLSGEYGLAIAHHGDYCWLSTPDGVWRASLKGQSVDLTDDVVCLRQELGESRGRLVIELENSDGRYASPGEGEVSVLDTGCQLEVSPGYVTAEGNEVSSGLAFRLESYEHVTAGGKASLVLYAWDAWTWLNEWRARHQWRWNKESDEMSVKGILEFILARAGIKLEVKSQSSVITSYYPDFVIHPNTRGEVIIKRLFSFVPDVLLIEGNKAYLVNPQSSDSSVYAYGSAHPIFDGKYQKGAQELNRVQVEGYDSADGKPIIVDSFGWNEIDKVGDRLSQVEDRNIDTVAEAEQRGEAHLRQAEIKSVSGAIGIPPNCGQELYDVIDITDSQAGLSAQKKRVLGLTLVYEPRRGKYEQRLLLGAV